DPAPRAVAIKAARMVDGRSDRVISPAIVVVEGGKIAAAGSAVAIPAGATVIDLGGATLLPGLIDAHDHLTSDPRMHGYQSLGVSVPRAAIAGVGNARRTLLAGFTSVRNVGAPGYSDVALRDGIEAGEILGPRLAVSGPALGITGGHCDNNLLPSEYRHSSEGIADGPWQARA